MPEKIYQIEFEFLYFERIGKIWVNCLTFSTLDNKNKKVNFSLYSNDLIFKNFETLFYQETKFLLNNFELARREELAQKSADPSSQNSEANESHEKFIFLKNLGKSKIKNFLTTKVVVSDSRNLFTAVDISKYRNYASNRISNFELDKNVIYFYKKPATFKYYRCKIIKSSMYNCKILLIDQLKELNVHFSEIFSVEDEKVFMKKYGKQNRQNEGDLQKQYDKLFELKIYKFILRDFGEVFWENWEPFEVYSCNCIKFLAISKFFLFPRDNWSKNTRIQGCSE